MQYGSNESVIDDNQRERVWVKRMDLIPIGIALIAGTGLRYTNPTLRSTLKKIRNFDADFL